MTESLGCFRGNRGALVLAANVAMLLGHAQAQPQCSPWTPAYGGGGTLPQSTYPHAGAYWDPDGDGPAEHSLIVLGDFEAIGGVAMGHVARWDGTSWFAMGSVPFNRNEPTQVLTFDHDGNSATPEIPLARSINQMYAYIGGEWINLLTQLGLAQGVVGDPWIVSDIVLHDPDGDGPILRSPFVTVEARYVPELSPPGVDQTFRSHYTLGYINGTWVRFGDLRWGAHLASWDSDGSGPGPTQLYCFSDYGVHRLDGSTWTLRAPPLVGRFEGIRVLDPDGPGPQGELLVAFGNLRIQPLPAGTNSVAAFNGSQWEPMGTLNGVADDIVAFDADGDGPSPQRLVLGGRLSEPDSVCQLAEWNGSEWQPFGPAGILTSTSGASGIRALVSPPRTAPTKPMAVLGGFAQAGDAQAANIAMWNGSQFSQLSTGIRVLVGEGINEFAWFDPDAEGPIPTTLVAAGNFTIAGGRLVKRIAYWHQDRWNELGGGVSRGTSLCFIRRMQVWDPDGPGPQKAELVVVGLFSHAGSTPIESAARWNGTQWLALGAGVNGECQSVCVWDPDDHGPAIPRLLISGYFTSAGGVASNGIATWDGTQWGAVGPVSGGSLLGTSPRRVASCLWDPDGPGGQPAQILVAGNFNQIGGVSVNSVARWDGAAWRPLGNGLNGGLFNIWAMDPDGPGPLEYSAFATGTITGMGGNPFTLIARWDTTAWRTMGDGLNDVPDAMMVYDSDGTGPQLPRLVLSGRFVTSGAQTLGRLATWNGGAFRSFGSATWRAAALISDPSAPSDAPRLILGGEFANIDGRTYSGIAQTTQPFERFYAVADRSRVCPGDQAAIEVAFESGATYRWYRAGVSPVAISDGAQASSSSVVSGALTHRMEIAEVDASFAGEFYCVVTPPVCGVVTTNRALLTVAEPGDRVCLGCGECISDYDQDGGVSGGDIAAFFADFETGAPCADVDQNGGVDGGDIGAFFVLYEAGGC